jgi:hypothetical protein
LVLDNYCWHTTGLNGGGEGWGGRLACCLSLPDVFFSEGI